MLEFNKCCFCIPLRTGCLILGYLHVVASIIRAILTILSLATIAVMMAHEYEYIDGAAAAAAIAFHVILLLIVIGLLTFSVLLVVGLHKEKRNYVKAYLIYYLIFIVLYAIMCIVQIASTRFKLSFVLGTLVQFLLSVYFLLVIRSHWVTMRENNFNTA